MTRIDVTCAGIIDRQLHPAFRIERADHLGNLLQEIAEVYAIAVDPPRQRLVEFSGGFDARADVVEQDAKLSGREALAALRNGVALEANDTAQAGQIVGDTMVGLSHLDRPVLN